MSASRPSRTALVTGASGGIGRALAEQFARAGTDLVLSARNGAALEAIAADWRGRYGIAVTVFAADLSQPGAAQALFEAVRDAGVGIDFLVNNAGVGRYGLFADADLDAELAMMRLNMEALTVLTHRFLPGIRARRGKILNLASTAAFQPGPYMAVYYATKAFVLLFSEALGAELAGTGVTVTALCPGPTASGFQDQAAMGASALVRGKRLPSAESVAEAGYRAMLADRPVFIPGMVNRLLAFSVRLTPRAVITAVSRADGGAGMRGRQFLFWPGNPVVRAFRIVDAVAQTRYTAPIPNPAPTVTTNSVVRARVSDDVKRQATTVLAGMGLTVSDAVRILLTKVAREKALPFELTPNALTADTLRKSARGEDVHHAQDADALFEELGI